MTQYKEIIHDIETNEVTERVFSTAEVKSMEEAKTRIALESQQLAEKEALRQAAFAKLGLTAEEIAAITS